MSETNYEALVAAGDWPEWRVRFEDDQDDCTAIIHRPLDPPRAGCIYEIAVMGYVPTNWETLFDGEERVVDVSDLRTRELCAIVHVPDLLNAIRKAVMRLELLTGLHGDDATCNAAHAKYVDHKTWQALAEIECDLIRAYDAATDAEEM